MQLITGLIITSNLQEAKKHLNLLLFKKNNNNNALGNIFVCFCFPVHQKLNGLFPASTHL